MVSAPVALIFMELTVLALATAMDRLAPLVPVVMELALVTMPILGPTAVVTAMCA